MIITAGDNLDNLDLVATLLYILKITFKSTVIKTIHIDTERH